MQLLSVGLLSLQSETAYPLKLLTALDSNWDYFLILLSATIVSLIIRLVLHFISLFSLHDGPNHGFDSFTIMCRRNHGGWHGVTCYYLSEARMHRALFLLPLTAFINITLSVIYISCLLVASSVASFLSLSPPPVLPDTLRDCFR